MCFYDENIFFCHENNILDKFLMKNHRFRARIHSDHQILADIIQIPDIETKSIQIPDIVTESGIFPYVFMLLPQGIVTEHRDTVAKTE